MRNIIVAAILFGFALSTGFAHSDTITIEATAFADGSLANQSFSNTFIRITGIGDTDNVVTSGNANLLLKGFEVSIEIEGIGSAVFSDVIQAVSNNNSDLGGFGNTSNEFGLLLIFNDAFGTYDLLGDLDPVSGFGVIVIGVPHQTTAGSLRFFDIVGDATISATVTSSCPFEPGDLNRDGSVNLLDVGPFVDALTSGEFACQADLNNDGDVNLLDVDPFVTLLGGG